MKERALIVMVFASSSGLCHSAAQAQQLTLFEPTQGERQNQETQARPQEFPGPAPIGLLDPAFTLSSAGRFGDSFQAILRDRSGQSVVLGWQPGQRTPLPGHAGFVVVDASARSVTLELPAAERCMALPERGVACNGDTLAVLSLATLAPLAGKADVMQVEGGMGPEQGPFGPGQMVGDMMVNAPINGEAVFVNPFVGIQDDTAQLSEAEVQARVDAARARAQRLQQFQPERINEADVPAGMRLVRTPFGDRLVPIRE